MYMCLSPGAIGVNLPFEEAARLAAAHGFQGIQIDAGYAAQVGPERVREVLESVGLKPGSFGLPLDVRERDDAAYQEALYQLEAKAKAAKEVGCTRCSTWIPSWDDTRDYDEAFVFYRDRLRPAAQILADQGIALGLEFLGPKTLRDGKPFEFIHTIEGMLKLCDAIGTGNAGLLLDAWHWYTSGAGEKELEGLTAANVVDVHINDAPAGLSIDEQLDNVRCLPGETGVIPMTPFLQALAKMGYQGPVTPEPFSARLRELPPEEAIRETAEAVKKVWRAAGLPGA